MKSLDLKSVNVQALNDDELRLVDGGFDPVDVLVGLLVWGIADSINHPDDFWAGFTSI